MHRRWRTVCGVVVALGLLNGVTIARTVRDDLGRTVTVPARVRRIVSLTPAATESLFALGAGERVVGVCSACDYPPSVKKLPQVGDFAKPSLERIVALRPDLIVISSATIPAAIADDLQRRAGVPVFVLRPQTLQDVMRGLVKLGDVVHRLRRARQLVAQLQRRLDAVTRQIKARQRGRLRPTVVVEIAPPPSLMVVGSRNYIDDAIARAGGRNAFADAPQPFPVVSLEALVAKDPDVYIVATKKPSEAVRDAVRQRAGFGALRCVRAGRVFAVDPDLLLRPTPRLVDGVEKLAQLLWQGGLPLKATPHPADKRAQMLDEVDPQGLVAP
ncbi:Vitamin B12-binding protein [bacterium HR17]|uniref:Vitamin B12-binding protein n=1 Tax=Candidatus Fervidibacter japonicus TaxID=2035412 RepID=A0A2H5XEK2_9BACT|nr:Vitamin B12-binding protein [bacterium HR17]